MARYQVILAYDGTPFAGFQRQAKVRTVQSTVEAALKKIGWQEASILAAGRTDRGVHAVGQVVAFDLQWRHSEEDLRNALNANLPQEVAARKVNLVDAQFHPRYHALARQYCYFVFSDRVRNPARERYAWRVWPAPKQKMLQSAAQIWLGEHDFHAFGQPPKPHGSTIRTVYRAEWLPGNAGWVFRVTANGFLYHMVRHLVYMQMAVAQNKLTLEEVQNSLQTGILPAVQGMAPPNGLFLTAVDYHENVQNWSVGCVQF